MADRLCSIYPARRLNQVVNLVAFHATGALISASLAVISFATCYATRWVCVTYHSPSGRFWFTRSDYLWIQTALGDCRSVRIVHGVGETFEILRVRISAVSPQLWQRSGSNNII